jgi:N-formylglutamate amidohydrolase
MGAVYEKTADLRPLRKKLSPEERRALVDRFYRSHHRQLSRAVGLALARSARCLIVDGHSFPSAPLPYEHDQSLNRPDICIGTDDFHTPVQLAAQAVAIFERAGLRTAVNRPFAGAVVPIEYYCQDPAVASIMIEVNRGLYMDEQTGGRMPAFEDLRLRLAGCLTLLAEVFEKMGRTT